MSFRFRVAKCNSDPHFRSFFIRPKFPPVRQQLACTIPEYTPNFTAVLRVVAGLALVQRFYDALPLFLAAAYVSPSANMFVYLTLAPSSSMRRGWQVAERGRSAPRSTGGGTECTSVLYAGSCIIESSRMRTTHADESNPHRWPIGFSGI